MLWRQQCEVLVGRKITDNEADWVASQLSAGNSKEVDNWVEEQVRQQGDLKNLPKKKAK